MTLDFGMERRGWKMAARVIWTEFIIVIEFEDHGEFKKRF